jgi:3-hydroxy acid dehydrogenase / malonic semialdehyde reductase
MPQDISGWVALITGASSGIGSACAQAFAQHGCRLVLIARRADRLQELSERLSAEYKVWLHSYIPGVVQPFIDVLVCLPIRA